MIRIITDSAADFTQEELRRLDIHCVPMTISFSDETYRDGVDLTSETFWQRMQAGETPKTSQPSPDAFLSEFEEAKACGDSVICILISTALSGTVQSAMIARDMADDDSIQIIDTLSAAVGERLLVLQACRLRDEGKDAQTIAAELTVLIPRVRIFACLDTLEYLARGGRIPKAAAGVGMLVKLKPIVTVSREGLVEMAGKAIGASPRRRRFNPHDSGIRHRRWLSGPAALHLYHGKLLGISSSGVAGRNFCDAEKAVAIGSTIGTHVGPGAFGLAFIAKRNQHPLSRSALRQ